MSESVSAQNLIIILTATIPSALFATLATLVCWRARQRAKLFQRSATPIDDEEIASWKLRRTDSEKLSSEDNDYDPSRDAHPHVGPGPGQAQHVLRPSPSVRSVQTPPSVIRYQAATSSPQYDARSPADDDRPNMPLLAPSPSPSPENTTFGLPAVPMPPPVLARAPNARPGLTDEALRGDDAFVARPRRCSKAITPPPCARSKSTRTPWHGGRQDSHPRGAPPRRSLDTFVPATDRGNGVNWSPGGAAAPRSSFEEDLVSVGRASLHDLMEASEIGRAIG